MLIKFRFSNYRSFRDQQELSLVAGSFSEKTEIPRFAEAIKSSLLPVAAIYGANASGKTNALRAIFFFVNAVGSSHSRWNPDGPIPFVPFLNSTDAQLPSVFEIDFIAMGIRYRYGFSLNAVAVLEEWLYAYPKGKKQTWFHRIQGRPISFSTKLSGENKTIENLTRKNSLFLSAAAQNNHEILAVPYRWISELLFVMGGTRSYLREHTAELCKSAGYLKEVTRLMSVADLGVTGISIDAKPSLNERTNMPADTLDVLNSAQSRVSSADPLGHLEVRMFHRVGDEELPFSSAQESQGTLAYFDLLGPVVRALKTGVPLIVDELDVSLHPLLSTHIVRLFNEPDSNPMGAQLIFNTHDTNLLGSGSLRRDQVWLSEKGDDGSSHLFPLSDFKLRRTDNLQSGYLAGRYGAVPFIDPPEVPAEAENVGQRS